LNNKLKSGWLQEWCDNRLFIMLCEINNRFWGDGKVWWLMNLFLKKLTNIKIFLKILNKKFKIFSKKISSCPSPLFDTLVC
jgi:hypothetical protein